MVGFVSGGFNRVHAADSFNRANGAIGTADTGQSWATLNSSSTFNISSNQAAPTTVTGTLHTPCVVDAGVSDCVVSCDFVSSTSGIGFVFRCVDDSNYWLALIFDGALYKKVAGSFTFVQAITAGSGTWTAELAGSSIVLKNAGVSQATVTDGFNSTATRYGFSSVNTAPGPAYDNFSVSTTAANRLVIPQAVRRSYYY